MAGQITVIKPELRRHALKTHLLLLPIHLRGQPQQKHGQARRGRGEARQQVGERGQGPSSLVSTGVEGDAVIFVEHPGFGKEDCGGPFGELVGERGKEGMREGRREGGREGGRRGAGKIK